MCQLFGIHRLDAQSIYLGDPFSTKRKFLEKSKVTGRVLVFPETRYTQLVLKIVTILHKNL